MYVYQTMGWLQSVGSIKLYVSFAEYRLFYRAFLPKRPMILSILLTKATPYMYIYVCVCVYIQYMYICVCVCVYMQYMYQIHMYIYQTNHARVAVSACLL